MNVPSLERDMGSAIRCVVFAVMVMLFVLVIWHCLGHVLAVSFDLPRFWQAPAVRLPCSRIMLVQNVGRGK